MESVMVSDAQLIKEARKGNLTSFETLMKRYEKKVASYAYKKLLDNDGADDVVQETFVRIFKNLEKFDEQRKFSSWMYTIAKNLCFDILRKGRHQASLEWDIEDTKEALIWRIIRSEQITALRDAIKGLPEKYKLPLLGYYFANLSYRQLSFNLNMSENTIKTRIRRAKGYLRTELERKGYG